MGKISVESNTKLLVYCCGPTEAGVECGVGWSPGMLGTGHVERESENWGLGKSQVFPLVCVDSLEESSVGWWVSRSSQSQEYETGV